MLALLSPAKKLDETPLEVRLPVTRPCFADDTEQLMKTTRRLGVSDLKALMHISDALAELNHARFQTWTADHDPATALPAALTFAGDVYQGLDARSLAPDDLAWAQDHVAILSGLYGLLRPLDLMHPYRLEMGSKLNNPRGKDLYAFWADRIAPRIDELTRGHADRTVVNLASNEYFSAVKVKALQSPVLHLVFQDVKDGKARSISFYAKRARGAMARWLIENRAEGTAALKEARPEGYAFDASASAPTRWIYRRPQPPPVGRKSP
jgi:cytoplasmic iron level regulating protein YaaA (DUF328/UPF0246 family)